MSTSRVICLVAALMLAGCAQPGRQFLSSTKSAVELRALQTRVIPADKDRTMRAVVETLHDLGYRITRVEPDAGTVSGTRKSTLRLSAVVQERSDGETAVRANASIISPLQEAQVDSAEFYLKNFFVPLGTTLGRTPRALTQAETAPAAPQTVAELNTQAEREAAAQSRTQTTE